MDLGVTGSKIKGSVGASGVRNSSISRTKAKTKTTTTLNPRRSSPLKSRQESNKVKSKANKDTTGTKDGSKEKKVAETLQEQASKLLMAECDPTSSGSINVRFNHYNKPFPVYNGILKWVDVDEEYAISFVYKGAYRREIYLTSDDNVYEHRKLLKRDEKGDFFFIPQSSLMGESPPYKLELEEDAEAGIGVEGLTLREGPISFHKDDDKKSGNRQTELLTQDLKNMHAKGGAKALASEEAKLAIEARDVEEILFS
jgi:hypothetical protein